MLKFRLIFSRRLRYAGNGYKLAGISFSALLIYTYLKGPHIENELLRLGLTGLASTLFVELACQPIDTLNMKAKTDKRFGIRKFVRVKGMTSLMRGIQPVIYGMAISSFVYFILYKKIKDFVKAKMDQHDIDKTTLSSVFMMSAGASALANFCAIGLYYPYDLMKTRMQVVGQYNYKNVIDAFHKIRGERGSYWKFMNFFRGFGLYSLTFITFTTLEFSIYETIMMYLARGQIKSKLNKKTIVEKEGDEQSEGLFEHREDKNISHILISSAVAGAIGGFLTNPLEFFLVNKQANSKNTLRKLLKENSVYDIFLNGSLFRTVYLSSQALMIFFLLEKLGAHLNCEI